MFELTVVRSKAVVRFCDQTVCSQFFNFFVGGGLIYWLNFAFDKLSWQGKISRVASKKQ